MIDRIADSDVSVLLSGESGVGKGVVAHALHRRSKRYSAPFVTVNCAALPGELLESELFGHERGAFTGAVSTRIGKFEHAEGGTLLLDEIGEMSPSLQAKLLHVLQDGEFTKLGSNRQLRVDVRVVAATNRNLELMRASGAFREDLYYRLGVIELTIPPLRERLEEIDALTDYFASRYSEKYARPFRPPSAELRQLFVEHDWPGNIRELENMIKRIVVLQDEEPVRQEIHRSFRRRIAFAASAAESARAEDTEAGATETLHAPPASHVETSPNAETGSLLAVGKAAAQQAERVAIAETLDCVHWNRRKAAQILGVSYKTLLNKMKGCGLGQI